jgi:hypothetical protein
MHLADQIGIRMGTVFDTTSIYFMVLRFVPLLT